MYAKALILCVATFAMAAALPASGDKTGSENDLMASIYADCLKKESLSCIKYKVFSYVDKMLADKEDISLSEGITVVKTSNIEEGAPRSIESSDFDALLFDRLGRFLRSHTVKVDLKGSDILGAIENAGRSFSDDSTEIEGRGKKKKAAKVMGPIMMAIALKAAALLPIALGFIALIAGKALLIGKIALVISTIIGLKKLLGGQQKHVTYEVVSHPHHSSSHSVSHDDGGHGGYSGGGGGSSDFGGYGGGSSGGGAGGGHGGWARSLAENAQQMAYSAQKPAAVVAAH